MTGESPSAQARDGAAHPGESDSPAHPVGSVDLAVGGMTCASCVSRVEKKLNRVPGASATVNLALESAHVDLSERVDVDDLVRAVESAGYTATPTRVSLPEHDETPVKAHDVAGEAPEPSDHTGAAHGDGQAAASDAHGDRAPMAGHDHDAPTPTRAADLRRRLIVAAILTVPVAALSMIPPLQFPGWQWVTAALALPVATWCAWPFHKAAARAARHGASTMDTLVSIGIIAATLWSLWALTLGGAGEIGMTVTPSLFPAQSAGAHHGAPEMYFETAAVVATFLLAGRYAELRARTKAGDALRALLDMGAKEVTVVSDGAQRTIPIGDLGEGDTFIARPGEKIATDGIVIEGNASIDASLLTGESVPVDVAPGDAVTGATINTDGHLVIRATGVGEQTKLAQIARLVADAQTGKAPVQRLADRVSAVFVPVVIAIALLTLAVWLLTDAGAQASFTAAVAVLIIACPCALGLATPTALLVGTGRGAQLGILIKGPEVLESTRRVDTIVLDKTGTLTEGRMRLVGVTPAVWLGASASDIAPVLGEATEPGRELALALAGALESRSEHPIAKAIASASEGATATLLARLTVTDFVNEAGFGVSARIGLGPASSAMVQVGRASWLDSEMPGELRSALDEAEKDGATAAVLAIAGRPAAVLTVADEVKPTSADAVRELRSLGLTPVLLTGDTPGAALSVADAVGIDAANVIAEVLPADKVARVAELQAGGHVVAMVGDGVNDAAALAAADLGMAMGTGSDVAANAAPITLVRGDLAAAPQAIRLSKATLRIIKQNLFWAFAYNSAAIPLAAFGLLNPMIAGAAMAASSVIVVGNSLRLRRFT